ncbi:hypothetical protein M9Y10_029814 [Tritrichomonas musculus]|uniref:Uncharacterized protein n=1 Tax=Tritrichomonas musculus TaxID=1915356 RepID=A0ABR2KP15_9EUKA
MQHGIYYAQQHNMLPAQQHTSDIQTFSMDEQEESSSNGKEKIPPLEIVGPFEGTEEEFRAFTIAVSSDMYRNAHIFCEQVGALYLHLRNGYFKVSYRRIGELFNKNKSTIRDQ